MTIVEALNSGKEFKRKNFVHWMTGDISSTYTLSLLPRDLLADDWELKPEKVKKEEITAALTGKGSMMGLIGFMSVDSSTYSRLSKCEAILYRILKDGLE